MVDAWIPLLCEGVLVSCLFQIKRQQEHTLGSKLLAIKLISVDQKVDGTLSKLAGHRWLKAWFLNDVGRPKSCNLVRRADCGFFVGQLGGLLGRRGGGKAMGRDKEKGEKESQVLHHGFVWGVVFVGCYCCQLDFMIEGILVSGP